MEEDQAAQDMKRSKPKYYVVTNHGGTVSTKEFENVRQMRKELKGWPRDTIIGVFRGRLLDIVTVNDYRFVSRENK